MKIELKEITVREVANGYRDSAEEGVVGYGGLLDIRPKYQREFIYDEKKRDAVLDTIRKEFPLNVMYWVVTDQGTYEVMDGQQRTISFCQYVVGDFSIPIDGHPMAFHNLPQTLRDQILDYKLMVYFCTGTDKEKLDWFRIINIAGVQLTDQELRNAVYTGPWLTHAKTIFSRTNCAAYLLAHKYVNGTPIRQEFLQTAISWLSGGQIEQYMSAHQHDPNANELWAHFQAVISWVQLTFTTYRKEMKGLAWGGLYNQFKGGLYDTARVDEEIKTLMVDDDVTSKKGIYLYVLTRDEKHLSIRVFTEAQRREAFERQDGTCPKCGQHFEIVEMEADHITPWSKGGKTNAANCQMLCREDNRRKGAI
ncbi:MAG: HNH endonuclease [Chloroflexi bacterium HGW-Chloroflexi-9]|nr:MAG: HNH endonuclease [Chloroflexi bacterium HGW-Chloroflexi-9]